MLFIVSIDYISHTALFGVRVKQVIEGIENSEEKLIRLQEALEKTSVLVLNSSVSVK